MAPAGNTTGGWRARAKRAVVFLAIVWGVAGSFILFELIALHGTDLALGIPALERFTMSAAVTSSTSCAAPTGEHSRAADSQLTPAQVRSFAWLMGLNTGRDAVVRQWVDSDVQQPNQYEQAAATSAGFLSVPAPDRFVPRRVAEAHREFIPFVESSDRQTARQLAMTYGPAACETYKLGALWGYAAVVRPMVPGERGLFAPEIRHHATRIALPEDLWTPLAGVTPTDSTREAISEQNAALSRAILEHLQR